MPGTKLGEESLVTTLGLKVVTIEKWQLDELRLDPLNPRFSDSLDLQGKLMSEKEMEENIWNDSESKALYQSILAYGGLTEKPWITSEGVVKEGNRRIVCLRKIKENIRSGRLKNVSAGKFDLVECRVFPKGIADVEILALMGQWHVTGKREWRAHNQAKFIYELYESYGLTLDKISTLIGKSIPFLVQKKWAYGEMVRFAKSRPKQAKSEHFSYFEEMYKQRNELPVFVKKEGGGKNSRYVTVIEKMEELYDLILNEKFEADGARGLRKLPEFIKYPNIYETFKNEGLKKAEMVLATIKPAIGSFTFEAISACTDALNSMPSDELLSIRVGDVRYRMLKELETVLQRIISEIEARK